jgi:hypothetical protein
LGTKENSVSSILYSNVTPNAKEVNVYLIVCKLICANIAINTKIVEIITKMKSINHPRPPSPLNEESEEWHGLI